jgi:predicted amidohydrolase YtcJ
MAQADLDDARPTAEALPVADGRIVAVGTRSDVADSNGADTRTVDFGDGCVIPGLVEAHGHPLVEALAPSDRTVDLRPVTVRGADDEAQGAAGAYLNGWDPLLQNGLPAPELLWLDKIAPDGPLVILHNSAHKAYFNPHAARRAGLTRDTPDPKGANCATWLAGRRVHGQ